MCVRVRVRACVRVHVCVCMCVCAYMCVKIDIEHRFMMWSIQSCPAHLHSSRSESQLRQLINPDTLGQADSVLINKVS